MSNKNKNFKLDIDPKKPWEVGHGHAEHRSGAGKHDNRPKRERTRKAQLRKAIEEQE